MGSNRDGWDREIQALGVRLWALGREWEAIREKSRRWAEFY